MPYALRSGDDGEMDRDSGGGDLSEITLDANPWPTDDDVECDLDGLLTGYWESNVVSWAWARVGGDAIAVKGG
jgi:hypothetical protein